MIGPFRTLRRRRVIVNTKSERVFRGILWAVRGPLIVLRDAAIIEGGSARGVDGDIVLERRDVDFYQVLPAAEGG